MIDESRTTTQQMLDSPKGAVYVWCNSKLAYPKALARELQRDDLIVEPLTWLGSQTWGQRKVAAVTVDHAARLSHLARAALQHLQNRGTAVSTYF